MWGKLPNVTDRPRKPTKLNSGSLEKHFLESLNIVKITVLPKLIHGFNALKNWQNNP